MTDDPYRQPSTREPDEPAPDPRGPWVLQTWVSQRSCPCCGISLFAARKEGYRIDACGSCGGAWLDHITATRAIEERSVSPAALSDEAAKHATNVPPAVERRCPVCSVPLVMTNVPDAGVVIDTCAAHGAWFDPHEMRAVIEAMVRRKPPPVDPDVDRAIEDARKWGMLRPDTYRLSDWPLGTHSFVLDALCDRDPFK